MKVNCSGYCAAIHSISAVCASSRSVFYVIGNCIAISYYIKNTSRPLRILVSTCVFWVSLSNWYLFSHHFLVYIFFLNMQEKDIDKKMQSFFLQLCHYIYHFNCRQGTIITFISCFGTCSFNGLFNIFCCHYTK